MKTVLILFFIFSFGLPVLAQKQKIEPHKFGVLFVLDISGSMQGAPLDNVKKSLDVVAAKLPPVSSSGLISFHGCGVETVKVEVPLKSGRENHQLVRAKANNLSAGGATDILAALTQAKVEIERVKNLCINVILLSDGMDTCSSRGIEDVAKKIAGINNCNMVDVITVGVYGDVELGFFDRLAKSGNGEHKKTDDSRDVLEKLLELLARESGPNGPWAGDYSGGQNGGSNGGDGPNRPPQAGSTQGNQTTNPANAGSGSGNNNNSGNSNGGK